VNRLIALSDESPLKSKSSYFTRSGPLQPDVLVSLLLHIAIDGGRRGCQHLLEAFWEEAHAQNVALPTDEAVSAAAFCKARRKLELHAIRELLHQVSDGIERNHGKNHRVQARRFLAVDSSKISMHRDPKLIAAFGMPPNGHWPQCTVSTLFDVIAKVPVDASITPYGTNERDELLRLLDRVRPGETLLLDRGYPSYKVIDELRRRGIDFVMRVDAKRGFPGVRKFCASRKADAIIELEQRNPSFHIFEAWKVRAVRRVAKDGEVQIFLTTLRRSEFDRAEILDLYQRRWEIEVLFRHEKGEILGHGRFHSKHPEGIRQEAYALYLYLAITRTLMAATKVQGDLEIIDLSQKGAVFAVGRTLTQLLLDPDVRRVNRVLERLLERLARMVVPKREPRSCPRRSYKPTPRWGPQGKLRVHDRAPR
jgi:hypothetical protein